LRKEEEKEEEDYRNLARRVSNRHNKTKQIRLGPFPFFFPWHALQLKRQPSYAQNARSAHAHQRMSLIRLRQASPRTGGCRSSLACVPRGRGRSDFKAPSVLTALPPSGFGYHNPCMTSNTNGTSGSRVQVSVSKGDIRIAAPNVDLESLPDYLKKECLLFYYPDQEILAKKIAAASSSIQLSEVKWA